MVDQDDANGMAVETDSSSSLLNDIFIDNWDYTVNVLSQPKRAREFLQFCEQFDISLIDAKGKRIKHIDQKKIDDQSIVSLAREAAEYIRKNIVLT